MNRKAVTNVLFVFRENASEEEQERVVGQILSTPGVLTAGRISPTATKPALRRLWYAEVADNSAAEKLIAMLRGNEAIQSAELPAQRGLA